MSPWSLAENVADVLAANEALQTYSRTKYGRGLAVWLDGLDTFAHDDPTERFPYLLLSVQSVTRSRDSHSCSIRAVLAIHAGTDGDTTKPASGSRAIGAGEDLEALLQLIYEAVENATPGSVLTETTTNYELVQNYPVQTAEIVWSFEDVFSFN